jgi:glutamine synthetase
MFDNSDELLKYVKDEGVEMIDVRFCDLPGIMQHVTVPVSSFGQAVFDDGLNFDGSSIRGSGHPRVGHVALPTRPRRT